MTRRPRIDRDAEPSADAEAAREAALRILERRRHTRSDLARKLREKHFAAPTIEGVLDRLAAVGLVDDVEFARAFLSSRLGRRPTGLRRLRDQLRVHGVGEETANAALALIGEREGVPDEVDAARRLVAQSARRYAALEPRVRQQRLYALLARRGFAADVIRRALAMPAGDPED